MPTLRCCWSTDIYSNSLASHWPMTNTSHSNNDFEMLYPLLLFAWCHACIQTEGYYASRIINFGRPKFRETFFKGTKSGLLIYIRPRKSNPIVLPCSINSWCTASRCLDESMHMEISTPLISASFSVMDPSYLAARMNISFIAQCVIRSTEDDFCAKTCVTLFWWQLQLFWGHSIHKSLGPRCWEHKSLIGN